MTNPSAEKESFADHLGSPLSVAALDFAEVLGRTLARQWIQDQTDATDPARCGKPDKPPHLPTPPSGMGEQESF